MRPGDPGYLSLAERDEIAALVRGARLRLGLSQRVVGAAIGVSQATIAHLENGYCSASRAVYEAAAAWARAHAPDAEPAFAPAIQMAISADYEDGIVRPDHEDATPLERSAHAIQRERGCTFTEAVVIALGWTRIDTV